MNPMPHPTAAHNKLKGFVGKWVGEEKMHPSPMDPKGGPAKGVSEYRLVLDGLAIVQDYVQERDGKVSFRGHSVIRFEPTTKMYEMYWFDTSGMPPAPYRGTFEAGELQLIAPMQSQGQSRCVFAFRDEAHYMFRLEFSPDGKQWMPFIDGEYRRQG